MFLYVFFVLILRPPRSTRTYTLFPYTTLFRSPCRRAAYFWAGRHGALPRFRRRDFAGPCPSGQTTGCPFRPHDHGRLLRAIGKAVPLPTLWQPRHDRTKPRGRRPCLAAGARPSGLANLVKRADLFPGRSEERRVGKAGVLTIEPR